MPVQVLHVSSDGHRFLYEATPCHIGYYWRAIKEVAFYTGYEHLDQVTSEVVFNPVITVEQLAKLQRTDEVKLLAMKVALEGSI